MQRLISVAAAVLAIQIVLAVAITMSSTRYAPHTPENTFLDFDPTSVTTVEITGKEGNQLVLRKAESGWILPGSLNMPAAGQQITSLLEKLAKLKQGMAVATTAGADKRFKVAADDFERHLVLKAGDVTVADFYLGTSAGFRQSHARNGAQQDVVAIELGTYEVEPTADRWLDTSLLKINKEEVAAVAFAGFTLHRKDDSWQLDQLTGNEATESDKAEELITKVCNLLVQDVLPAEAVASLFADSEPALQFTLTKTDGSGIRYQFAQPEKEDYFVLKTSAHTPYFKVYNLLVEDIKEFSRNTLLKQATDNTSAATKSDTSSEEQQ